MIRLRRRESSGLRVGLGYAFRIDCLDLVSFLQRDGTILKFDIFNLIATSAVGRVLAAWYRVSSSEPPYKGSFYIALSHLEFE